MLNALKIVICTKSKNCLCSVIVECPLIPSSNLVGAESHQRLECICRRVATVYAADSSAPIIILDVGRNRVRLLDHVCRPCVESGQTIL